MKKILLALTALALGVIATSSTAHDPDLDVSDFVAAVCPVIAKDYGGPGDLALCTTLDQPTIVLSPILHYHPANKDCKTKNWCLRGLYLGGDYVFVLSDMPDDIAAAVALHETVHWIFYKLGINDKRCESERFARLVAGQAVTGWEERYGCPSE